MASSKLLALGGLGASAAPAVIGLGTTLTAPAAVFYSSLFPGLADNSANLYLTFI